MRLRTLCAILLCTSACSSGQRPSTGGSTTGGSTEFSGQYTATFAFFQTLVPSSVEVFLFGDDASYTDCGSWQQSPYSGNYVDIVIGANTKGTYTVAQSSNELTLGSAFAAAYENDDTANSASGSIVLSQVSNGSQLSGNGQITWTDGEEVVLQPFVATYCPADTTDWSGSTTNPPAAFFNEGPGDSNQAGYTLYLLSQTTDCSSWQQNPPPVSSSTEIIEFDIYATSTGTYSIVEAANPANHTVTALAQYGAENVVSEMDAASGSFTLSTLNPNSSMTGNIQVTWNDNTSLQVSAFTATYCPLPNG